MDEQTLEALHRAVEMDLILGVMLAEEPTYPHLDHRLTHEKVIHLIERAFGNEEAVMDRPPGHELAANTLVSWQPGEPKAPMYERFTVVNKRKLDQDSIDAGWYAQWGVRWSRWWRNPRKRHWDTYVMSPNELRTKLGLPRVEVGIDPVKPPTTPDLAPGWTLISDVRLEGEEAAQALGLDNEWRAILGMPPQPASALDGATLAQVKRVAGIELIADTYLLADVALGLPEELRLTPEEARALATSAYDHGNKNEETDETDDPNPSRGNDEA